MREKNIVCWFSGGRDSAVACKIAYDVARQRGWRFRLVHIDTRTPRPSEVDEYVEKYAEWLGAELIVLRPKLSFREYAEKYAYWPLLYHNRWCYYHLKRNVVISFLRENTEVQAALHVFAIRKKESLFREREYNSVFGVKQYTQSIRIRYWLPLLYADSYVIEQLIRKHNIPRSPVWHKLGSSGECQCLAGTSYRTLVRLAIHYPEVVEELAKIDDVIQQNRRKGPSYPAPLISKKVTLREWWGWLKKQTTLIDFSDYCGKAEVEKCVCML